MSSTSLILRPTDAPPIHVLEADGPRLKHPRRRHCIFTDNLPRHSSIDWVNVDPNPVPDPALADWSEPHWEICQYRNGSIIIYANRPTEDEIIAGDLQGALGSVIKIARPSRSIFRRAMRIARRLLRCDPKRELIIPQFELIGIHSLETDLPVYVIQASPQ